MFQGFLHSLNKFFSDALPLIFRQNFKKRNIGIEDTVGKRIDKSNAALVIEGEPNCVASMKDVKVRFGVRMARPIDKKMLQLIRFNIS